MKNENTLPDAVDRVLKMALLAVAMWTGAPNIAAAQTDTPRAASSAPAGGVPAQAASTETRTRPARRAIEFSPENIATAFKYIDKNKDGRISREEASAIRGVARNFDRADLDQNGSLSRKEFENAMNRAKSK